MLVLLTSVLLSFNPQCLPGHEIRIFLRPESCAPGVPSSLVDPTFCVGLTFESSPCQMAKKKSAVNAPRTKSKAGNSNNPLTHAS